MNQRIRFTGPRGWQRTGATAEETTPQAQDDDPGIEVDEPRADPARPPQALARQEASWLSSSFDLMTGLHVSDFEDTVPSAWLDELGL